MTYKELFAQLTPEQMEQQIAIFIGDEEAPKLDVSVDISTEDLYWEHADCMGNLEQVKADNPEDWEEMIENLTKVPTGCATLHLLD